MFFLKSSRKAEKSSEALASSVWRSEQCAVSRTMSIAPLSLWFSGEPGYRPEWEFLLCSLSQGLLALKLSQSFQVTGRRETVKKEQEGHPLPAPLPFLPSRVLSQCTFLCWATLCPAALGHSALLWLTQPAGTLLFALDCGSSASCPDAVQGLGRSLLAKCLLTGA